VPAERFRVDLNVCRPVTANQLWSHRQLAVEAFFNRVRRHQRRTSGRKSTRELNRFGSYQVFFTAESQSELLEHLRHVPFEAYQAHHQQLLMAERPQQFLYRLHRDPEGTV
jgi:hypothetical protein